MINNAENSLFITYFYIYICDVSIQDSFPVFIHWFSLFLICSISLYNILLLKDLWQTLQISMDWDFISYSVCWWTAMFNYDEAKHFSFVQHFYCLPSLFKKSAKLKFLVLSSRWFIVTVYISIHITCSLCGRGQSYFFSISVPSFSAKKWKKVKKICMDLLLAIELLWSLCCKSDDQISMSIFILLV